ncbi:PP2C family protein-serine/threonine phosphatase [Streptomyces bangladeshensis]|uniref:PP2C family protein-serine/threonine phosphatase n=1 Tax=Streptomyces bangladeshensis TaxID=295352 RepID=UPI003D15E1CB
MEELNTFLRHYHPGQMTTACYLVAHRPSRTLTCAAARHPPPLLRHADGAGTCLDQPLRPPLSPRSRHPIPPGRPHPGQDDTLLLYTDGLIERCREETIIVPQRLTACARTTVGLDLADLCERFLRRRTGPGPKAAPSSAARISAGPCPVRESRSPGRLWLRRGDNRPAGEATRLFPPVCMTCRCRGRRSAVGPDRPAACSDKGGKHHDDSDCGENGHDREWSAGGRHSLPGDTEGRPTADAPVLRPARGP